MEWFHFSFQVDSTGINHNSKLLMVSDGIYFNSD